ncbi:MAG: hypothetical protein HOP19_14790 [Acidobacteria bacterium]|nr:hypothetical protein [Acidobacteriota bacterium]
MRATDLMIAQQDCFYVLHLRRDLLQPGGDGFFLDAFDAMDGGQRIAVGQHRQAFDNRFLVVLLAMKDRAFGGGADLETGLTLPPLTAFARRTELPQVVSAYAPVICALLVPAKGAG